MDDDLLAGILLVLAGAFILLGRMNIVDPTLVYTIWPALLLIFGLIFLYRYLRKKGL